MENLNSEKTPNQAETTFDTTEKENGKPLTWAEHLKRAKELIKQKISGEKASSEYYLLSEHLSSNEKRAWKDIIKDWDEDENINVSNELGNLMERYIKDPNYQFGVHRSDAIDGANYKTDVVLSKVMKNGLEVLGDDSSGSIRNDEDPNKAVSFCNNILNAIIFTKSSYKGSTGAVLVAIPSKYVDKEGEILPGQIDNVYNFDDNGNAHIKPEYMLGFAPNLGEGTTVEFVSKEEILNNHE